MMSGDQCRAKATDSLDLAKRAPNAWVQAEWTTTAGDWSWLATVADYQDQFQQPWLTSTLD
jgi:hypothetical protein